ncbi:fibronectin type III domain-containing protein [Proteiniclasticum sp. BAD-10]|uniref:Fibronectin type III domain-containing protein n=1 Tax=Proteiniclasticum sediminis TaxID=2804028 RepID=A0A941HS54_9CLOT|nr:fibronectin type III domain-containing protein [Proteiniclasticum sediminis]MBR0577318.1 fibronectin type III domain-containing protein [Proteiniclasticum sediminis]
MKKHPFRRMLGIALVLIFALPFHLSLAANQKDKVKKDGLTYVTTITPKERQAAAKARKALVDKAIAEGDVVTANLLAQTDGYLIPDYFGVANWAYSPPLTKFIDELPGLGSSKANALGQYIPVAVPDTTTYPGSDYYEIAVVEYQEKMHSELPATTNRGYVQISTSVVPGKYTALKQIDGSPILIGGTTQAYGVDVPHYLGPAILSESGRPVRIKFYNLLPTGVAGDLFIPVDTTVMGAGSGTMIMDGMPMTMDFTQNRANIHLHGNNTVWISDGTPHQWITPAGEDTHYPQGVSVVDVPDMENTSSPTDGATTLYYTNSQSARLMFYHDHSYGITRLNVYAGAAAPYLIQDDVEKDLINGTNKTGINPLLQKYLPDAGIPLVIQDRTFVDAATIMDTDPTWAWGTNTYTPGVPYVPTTGDLWYPHVYSPAQNPYASDGVNPYGRWMYGPWFWPPTSNIEFGPVTNPYYDPENPDLRPPLMPATPNPSAPGESFMDTPIVNGTAYPFMEVDPKTYRFRILNASNDRFYNLQLYIADDAYAPGEPGYLTEVKMIPATDETPLPAHREQIIPDPAMKGPDWIQIGTEGGFLPAPTVIPSQPITWNLNLTTFNVGNVDQHSLLLGTAERADVLVDFSAYAGKTLILYNDAPAPFPASDTRYDYYTNNADLTGEGGAPSTLPGKGPNIRTIMQIKVADIPPAAAYDVTALTEVFKKTDSKPGVFESDQEPIIIPQAAYNSAYNATYPSSAFEAYFQLDENEKTFRPIDKTGQLLGEVNLPFEPKAMQDEMGEVYDEYGRMSGMLGLTSPTATSVNAPFIPYGYASPPVEIFKGIEDLDTTPVGSLDDGTQIWKITHNGVDTHTIHTHLFSSQLVNRVDWAGQLLPPDANELGWKETFRVNPLEITYIAMRPKVPKASELPFDVPNSVRLIDPTLPEGAPLMTPPPTGFFDPQGNPVPEILNHMVNYGWEYVYHCHILSHEEMDMMHSVVVAVTPKAPTNLIAGTSGNGNNKRVNLTWTDNAANETGFVVERSANPAGPWTSLATLPAGTTTYSDRIGNTNNNYYYRVFATNTVGDTLTVGFPVVTRLSDYSNVASVGTVAITKPAAPTSLTAVVQTGPQVFLTWRDNANNETGFVIQRSTNGGTFTNLVTVNANNGTGSVNYTDTTVVAGNSYTYQVYALNAAGSSLTSNTASVTLASVPAAPTNVLATAVRSGNRNAKVTLTWKDNANNESGFVIERSTSADFTANLVSATVAANSTTFNTGNLSRNTPYYFRIRAINGAGVSPWTNASPLPILTP